jgi:hypothetical protein
MELLYTRRKNMFKESANPILVGCVAAFIPFALSAALVALFILVGGGPVDPVSNVGGWITIITSIVVFFWQRSRRSAWKRSNE